MHGFLVYYRSLGAESGVWICLGLSQHPGSFCLLRSELMRYTTPFTLFPKDPGFLTDKAKPSLNGLRIREARIFSYKGSPYDLWATRTPSDAMLDCPERRGLGTEQIKL